MSDVFVTDKSQRTNTAGVTMLLLEVKTLENLVLNLSDAANQDLVETYYMVSPVSSTVQLN